VRHLGAQRNPTTVLSNTAATTNGAEPLGPRDRAPNSNSQQTLNQKMGLTSFEAKCGNWSAAYKCSQWELVSPPKWALPPAQTLTPTSSTRSSPWSGCAILSLNRSDFPAATVSAVWAGRRGSDHPRCWSHQFPNISSTFLSPPSSSHLPTPVLDAG
jgi:hypothetical protein